jgi:pimeloyl-ACP methyl ester carboxylesterase
MRNSRTVRLTLVGLVIAGIVGADAFRGDSSSASAAELTAPTSPGRATRSSAAKPTIVLVHGAFADATGWQHVIPILERDGYNVVAVQNSLASLSGDVETTKRLIDAQTGPVVVVGHSYGGAVITGAAAGNANVEALVYIAAFAPEPGEAVAAFGEKYPAPLGKALKSDAAGFLYVDRAYFRQLFAPDVPGVEARVMAATQKPIHNSSFGESVPEAAWKTIPSWYIVATEDQALNPELERFYAKRINATTIEIKSSHVVFISHALEVARFIERAANVPRPGGA